MLTKLMIARETSQPWQWVSLEFKRHWRVTFIVCDSSLKMKPRQERNEPEHVARDGAWVWLVNSL